MPMESVSIVFVVLLIVLTVVLCVVGVYLVLVLMEVRRTLHKVNTTLDTAESRLIAITQPLQHLGGMTTGLATGMKVFETFVTWLNRHKVER